MSETLFPLILSNTDLSLWSMCPLRWYRERCQSYRKAGFNIDLSAGGSFAKGLEVVRKKYYNEKLPAEQAIEEGYHTVIESLHAEMDKAGASSETLKSPERMGLALKEYFRRFPLDMEETLPSELEDGSYSIEHKLTAELPILHPELGVPLIFKGKLDMLAKAMGRYYIVDEKTTKTITANTAELQQTAGQFIGYGWLCRTKGIVVNGTKIRKVAIQVREIKVEEFEVAMTDYQIDLWYESMLVKVQDMVNKYIETMKDKDSFKKHFNPDFQHGCTSFFRPCPFQDGCTSKYGESFIETNFSQLAWDAENRKEIPLTEYKQLLLGENNA